MLHKHFVVLAAIIVAGVLAAQTMADSYTFDETTGDWDDPLNWDPEDGPPGENDTATILDGQTCSIDTNEAASVLTIQDGGKVILEAGNNLTLGAQLGSGNTLVIDSGGQLEVQGGSTGTEPELQLYEDMDFDGTTAIDFPSGDANIRLFGDVTFDGTNAVLEGVCGSAGGRGTAIQHNGYDLTIGSGATLLNIGSNAGTGDIINNGTIEVDCANPTHLVEILIDGQNYGTGDWNILSGELKSDAAVTEWTTPGTAGTYTIDGGTWHFAGTCIDFSDTLIFKQGKFKFRDGETGISFENSGNFTFGGDASNDMVFEVTEDNSFEVGN